MTFRKYYFRGIFAVERIDVFSCMTGIKSNQVYVQQHIQEFFVPPNLRFIRPKLAKTGIFCTVRYNGLNTNTMLIHW